MEIKTPDLGVDSAEVSEIMVNVGEVVNEGDNIVLLESDKAAVEVPSPATGKITNIMVSEGDTVSEGVILINLETGASDEASESVAVDDQPTPAESNTTEQPLEAASQPAQPEPKIAPVAGKESYYALPDLGVDEAEVSEVMVAAGDEVEAEQSILLVESDKASVEVPAPVSGKIIRLMVQAGDTVKNGQDFIVIASSAGETTQATDSQSEKVAEAKEEPAAAVKNTQSADIAQPTTASASSSVATSNVSSSNKLTEEQVNAKFRDNKSDVYAGPAVRKLSRQLGIDITQVTGTAINQRIVKEDLFAYVKQRMQNPSAPVVTTAKVSETPAVASLPKLPDMSKTEIWGEVEREPLTRLQKVSIPQLNYNTLIPQVTQFDLADITETESFRSSIKAQYKAEGIGLTILAFIVKATAYALTQHPKFNSHLSDDNTELLIRKSVNMGIAVATPEGLVVPVIKNVQDKGIKQLAIEIGEMAKKARDKKLTPKDITGASFTISSQGNLGGTAFTPLVTWPQVGILGVSESSMQPRWNKETGEFEPRLMLPLSLSYDHRVINGADAAVFTRYVATLLADPRKILM